MQRESRIVSRCVKWQESFAISDDRRSVFPHSAVFSKRACAMPHAPPNVTKSDGLQTAHVAIRDFCGNDKIIASKDGMLKGRRNRYEYYYELE